MKITKCKYCDRIIKSNYNSTICNHCSQKRKYVRELVDICQRIKEECKK